MAASNSYYVIDEEEEDGEGLTTESLASRYGNNKRYRDGAGDQLENGHHDSEDDLDISPGGAPHPKRTVTNLKSIVVISVLAVFLIIALVIASGKAVGIGGTTATDGTKDSGFEGHYGPVQGEKELLGDHVGSGADGRNLTGEHPLRSLLEQASVLATNRTGLAERLGQLEYARQNYQQRYGRAPPREFEKWHAFQQKWKAKGQEGRLLYDSMMEQLAPFRTVHPLVLRQRIWNTTDESVVFTVHQGKVSAWSSPAQQYKGDNAIAAQFGDMLRRIADQVGDVEIPLNLMEESRTTISWETMSKATKAAVNGEYLIQEDSNNVIPQWTVDTLPAKPIPANYQAVNVKPSLRPDPRIDPMGYLTFPRPDSEVTGWRLMSQSCSPDSPARVVPQNPMAGHGSISSIAQNGVGWQNQFRNSSATAVGGFVTSVKSMMNICLQPDLQDLYGFAIRPNRIRVIRDQLFPMFSINRISGFSDIVVPGPHHWRPASRSKPKAWKSRDNRLYWRGPTSGSWIKGSEWHGSHRQRLISRLNRLQGGHERETVLVEKPISNKNLGSTPHLGTVTLNAFDLDEGLTNCRLTSVDHCEQIACDDMSNSSLLVFGDMETTQDTGHQFVLDLDDDGPSKDFIPYLKTGALVIKSSLMEEFYTSSLIAWYHFVPLEMRYLELYNILTWFRGFEAPLLEPKSDLEKSFSESELRAFETSLSSWDAGPKPPFLVDWIEKKLAKQAVHHPDKAKTIGEQGRRFVEDHLRPDDCLVYLFRLVVEWQEVTQINGLGGEACRFGGCLGPGQETDFVSSPWDGKQ